MAALGTVFTWTGTNGADWDDDLNWSGPVPGYPDSATDDAVIHDLSGATFVDLTDWPSQSEIVGDLKFTHYVTNENDEINFRDGGTDETLTVNGAFIIDTVSPSIGSVDVTITGKAMIQTN